MSQYPYSGPGIAASTLTLTPRVLFIMDTVYTSDFLPGGAYIDGAAARDPGNSAVRVDELRPGLILGKVNSTTGSDGALVTPTIGAYAASIMGSLTSAVTTASSYIVTSAAAATEVARRIGPSGTLVLTGAPTATGTVVSTAHAFTAVAYGSTTGTITLTPAAAFVAGTWIGAADGSAVPTTILCGDIYPIRTTDINGASMRQVPLRYIPITNKPYDVSNIVHYPAAANTTLIAYLKAKLRVPVPGATFSDDF